MMVRILLALIAFRLMILVIENQEQAGEAKTLYGIVFYLIMSLVYTFLMFFIFFICDPAHVTIELI